MTDTDATIADLRAMVDSITESFDAVEAERERLSRELDEARAEIERLRQRIDSATAAHRRTRQENENLRRAVDSAHSMIDARNREIEDLRNDLEIVALKERLLRYTGRTTAQMRSAPRDGEVVYVWPFPSSLDYPRRRVWELGRVDIKVVTPVWVRNGNHRGRFCHVIVDHATPIDMFDINQWGELVDHANRMNTCPTHAG